MDQTGFGATTLEETRAGDYYRRSGISSRLVRGRPGLRRKRNQYQVTQLDLTVGTIAELVVYPELNLRKQPWQFWGEVILSDKSAVILKQLSGEQAGTPVRIPVRYFWDGRVFRRDDNGAEQ